MNTLALLLSDTYKQCHDWMYPDGLEFLVSYWVPRKTMLKTQDKMVFSGLRGFMQKYLIDYFYDNFFALDEDVVRVLYTNYMDAQIGRGNYGIEKILALHRLGYLPLRIRALPEGSLVSMGVPCIELTNTHRDFAWLVQWIECILQVELWKPCAHATIGYMYRQVANKWYEKNVVGASPSMACADFGMRGMSSLEEAVKCSASWLLSFNKTSTIPALDYLDEYYGACCNSEGIGKGAVSTEHSVMGANYAVDGDEVTFVKKLLNEIYPNTSFSMVSDTYDYWNMVNNIIPQCKEDILRHNGKLLIRPDSGDMVEIAVGTVESLWNTFGGTINSKGYKVLNEHIGIIYGEGCTLTNIDTIWRILDEKGYAANNIFFGVGAFCFSAIFEDGKPMFITRDTFGIAMKATYGVINGQKVQIYKDPKTDTNKLKKSHRGCCIVKGATKADEKGRIVVDYSCQDGYTWTESYFSAENMLEVVFEDGVITKKESFNDIRKRLHGGGAF